jgi:hypothetical protein
MVATQYVCSMSTFIVSLSMQVVSTLPAAAAMRLCVLLRKQDVHVLFPQGSMRVVCSSDWSGHTLRFPCRCLPPYPVQLRGENRHGSIGMVVCIVCALAGHGSRERSRQQGKSVGEVVTPAQSPRSTREPCTAESLTHGSRDWNTGTAGPGLTRQHKPSCLSMSTSQASHA